MNIEHTRFAGIGNRSHRSKIFAASSLFALMAAGGANAQSSQPAPAPTQAVEEIVVTGTQIRGVAPVGAPVIAINQQEIAESGLNTTTDILHDIPQVTMLGAGQGYTGANQNANLNTNRDNAINIRGLGPQATLTLLDGRRTPLGGSTGNLFDPSSIPTIALGSIDILTGGSSALYGSDAVAGVANLVLRKNFDGLEVEASYGDATDYYTDKLGAIFGKKWSSGSAMIAVETDYASLLTGNQRSSITQCNVNGFNNCSFNYPTHGNVVFSPGSPLAYNGVPANTTGTGLTQAQLTAGGNYYNPDVYATLEPKTNRNSLVWSIGQDALENVHFWTEGYYTQNNTHADAGALAITSSGGLPATNVGYIPLAAGQTGETAYTNLNDYWGPERRLGLERAYQVAGGFTALLPKNWAINGYGEDNYNYEYTNTDALNATAEKLALACTTPGLCFDPFGPYAGNQAAINSFVGYQKFNYWQKEQIGNIKLDGPIFTLPGGEVKLAVGAEFQHNSLTQISNYTSSGPTIAIPVTIADYTDSRTIASVFGEMIIPVVSGNNELPFVKSFIIDVAGRYDRYSDVGSTANPKVSFSWHPLTDLTLHGDYGTSFRAPELCDTNPACTGTDFTSNTTYGAGVNTIELLGGNAGVKPETATTWSFGMDYKPTWFSGFDASLNYYNIDYNNVIGTPGQNIAPNTSVANGLNDPIYSALVIKNPSQAYLNYLATQSYFSLPTTFALANTNYVIIGERQNAGVILTQGLDYTVNYRWSNDLGAWAAGISGNYTIDYNYSVLPGLPLVHELNKWQYPVAWRFRTKFQWSKFNLTAIAYVNYSGAYENNSGVDGTPLNTTVGAYTTVDATLLYKITQADMLGGYAKNTTVSVSALDLFDTSPPRAVVSTTTQYDAEQASPLGRQVRITLRKAF